MNKPILNWETRKPRKRSANMLRAEEERRLIKAWQTRGDAAARDRLVAAFRPMAIAMARRFSRQGTEPDGDLVQQACIGVLKALDRFDLANGARFSTYAGWWMRAEIQDFKQANMSVVRRPNSAQFRMAFSKLSSLEETFLRSPDVDRSEMDAHVAEALGVSRDRLATLREQVTARDASLNIPAAGDGGEERLALLEDPQSGEERGRVERLDLTTLRAGLVDAVAALPPRERDIIVATQLQDPPATLEGLGARHGISKERVRQLRERGFERLRAALSERDLTPEEVL